MALKKVTSSRLSSSIPAPRSFTGPGRLIVVSKRSGSAPLPPGYTVIDVDRTHPTLGNHLFSDTPQNNYERDVQIRTFKNDFLDTEVGAPARRELDLIRGRIEKGERIALRCWCAPKDCHARIEQDYIMSSLVLDTRPSPTLVEASIVLYPWATGIQKDARIDHVKHYASYRASLQDIDLDTVPSKGSIKIWFDFLKSANVEDIKKSVKKLWDGRKNQDELASYNYVRSMIQSPNWHDDLYQRVGQEGYKAVLSHIFANIDAAELGPDEHTAMFYKSCVDFMAEDTFPEHLVPVYADVLSYFFIRSMKEPGSAGYNQWVSTWFMQEIPNKISEHKNTQYFYNQVLPSLAKYFTELSSTFEYETVSEYINPMPALSSESQKKLFSMLEDDVRIRYAVELNTGKRRPFPDGVRECIFSELDATKLRPMHWAADYDNITELYLSSLTDSKYKDILSSWKNYLDTNPLNCNLVLLLPKLSTEKQRQYCRILDLEDSYICNMLNAIDRSSKYKQTIVDHYSNYLPLIRIDDDYVFNADARHKGTLSNLIEQYQSLKTINNALTPAEFLKIRTIDRYNNIDLPGNFF